MRKYILYTLVLVLTAPIGCATINADKAKKFYQSGIDYAELGQHQQAIEINPKNVDAYVN